MNGAAIDPFLGRTVLGRYRVVRAIGRGGMGIIYLARVEGAARFVKPVVVKRAAPDLLAREPGIVQILGREARIMSHLHHPSIVSVIDFAADEGAYLLVLDYVHGFHLGQWHRHMRRLERPFPVDLAVRIVCTVLDALHYAHTARGADNQPLGIVHRDVSPGNVLIDVGGQVKLADFGIARMDSDHTEATTDQTMIKGKFAYMAPELLARANPSPSSDVYATGVVLHELLTGQNEFKGGSIEATIGRILNHAPSPVSAQRKDAPPGLDEAIARAVAKSPDDRYADAAEFARALQALPGMDGDDVERRLVAAIAADFRDPQMSETLGVPDLATLDRAWREPTDVQSADGGVLSPQGLEGETIVVPVTVRPPPPAKRTIALAVAAVVAVAALAGGIVLAVRRPAEPPAPAPVILVNGQVTDSSGRALAAATAPPTASAPDPTPAPAPASAPAPAPVSASARVPGAVAAPARTDGADALTRAFSRQEPQVARCFGSNASDGADTSGMAIRFGIDEAGHVTSAQVLPASVASTPLGACLAGVARTTQFGPQPHAVSFRIPIAARRTP
jgi:eukaryotic-like serine/threonine-protein kinase